MCTLPGNKLRFHLFSYNLGPFKHRTLTIHIGYFNEQFVSPTPLSFIHRINLVKLNRYIFGTQCKNVRKIPIPLFFSKYLGPFSIEV